MVDPIDAGESITSVFEPSDWVSNRTEDSEISLVDLQLAWDKAHDILETHKVEVSTAEAPDQLRHVARILRYQIATREPFAPSCPANIQVATLWGAKGVTADHVYVLGLCREALPGTRRDEYPGTDLEYVEEQRRLFYVSLTRAKTKLVLSRAVKIKRNEAKGVGIAVSTNGGQYPPLEVSPFLRDILAYLPNGVDGDRWAGAALGRVLPFTDHHESTQSRPFLSGSNIARRYLRGLSRIWTMASLSVRRQHVVQHAGETRCSAATS